MGTTRRATWIAALAVIVVACGRDGPVSPTPSLPATLGDPEGELRLAAYAGYAEEAWVGPFEDESGCQVAVTVTASSDEVVAAVRQGGVDGISASGLIAPRLIADGLVAPVNTALIPNYSAIFNGLKDQPFNARSGTVYGVPHGRGANLLMWRTDIVDPAPESWAVVYDEASPYAGRITGYDAAISIADAALFLAATRPELEITDPFALDEAQFAEAVALLKRQRSIIGRYWSVHSDVQAAFASTESVVGTGWQVIGEVLVRSGTPVALTLPKEGATGWSDTWMIAAAAPHPNCMYAWLNYIIGPAANAAATVYLGEAPVSPAACDEAERLSPGHCATYHAADEDYFSRVHYWSLPERDCRDDRGSVCVDYGAWEAAWAEIEATPR